MEGLRDAAGALLGRRPTGARPLHGGDLSEVTLLTFQAGPPVVAKTGPMVDREGRMLQAIRAAGAPAPEVLGVRDGLLLLEFIEHRAPTAAARSALGIGLRQLHGTTGGSYGWPENYAFGPVAIESALIDDWPAFWAERRLLAGIGTLPADLARRLEAVAPRLPDLLPARPEPALLHGDLWSGNVILSGDRAWFIDPACSYGHGDVDLAMLALFGHIDPVTADAYGPLEPGWADRRAAYQLWPALVHLRLFGQGYRRMVEDRLTRLGA